MESEAIKVVNELLIIIGSLILIGVIVAKIADIVKIPDVVFFLLVGILVGPSVMSLIDLPGESVANQLILAFGSALILFHGGTSLDIKVLKGVWKTIVYLATIGVVVTVLITGMAAHYLLGIPIIFAFLLASVIAAIDPATLIPVFQQVKIRERVSQTVLSESAFNDATAAILAMSLVGIVSTGVFSASESLIVFLKMVGFGTLSGLIVGFGVAYLIGHTKFGTFKSFAPVMSVIAVIVSYVGAHEIGGSGYMAVFIAGIILGNLDSFKLHLGEAHHLEQEHFLENLALIMRMFIFILLGTQVNFQIIQQYWLAGMGVVAVFMLVARPLTVLSSALLDRKAKWENNELLFMFWVRETGVIPAALAGILIGMKVPYADVIASITFLAILTTLLLQASTTKALAKKLGLLIDQG
ncbi:MAG: sodium:proton antiporter [Peptococcaceae bacterium]|nr:sodium:proton antiporter [Peptococcaceae bacterium]